MHHSKAQRKKLKRPIEAAAPPPTRPASVTILTFAVLIITVINLLRLILSLRYWDFLSARSGISPLYTAATGFIWTLAGLVLMWGLWKAKTWAPRLMQVAALTYALYYWLDLIFLTDHPLAQTAGAIRAILPVNWRFAAGITILCLAYIAWTLGRQKVRSYFGEISPEAGQSQVNDDNHE